MQTMRESWTDERLDDLNAKVDRGFERVETELRSQRLELKAEMNGRFVEVDKRFDKVDKRFDKVDERFDRIERRIEVSFDQLTSRIDALNRTLLGFAGAAIVALLASEVIHF